MTTTVVTWTTNPDGTVTPSWTADANPNLEDYALTATGFSAPATVPASQTSLPPLPGTSAYSLTVQPVLSPDAAGSASYTPPPVFKPIVRGFGDRGGVPKLPKSIVPWYVVDAPWSAFQSTPGGSLLSGNPLDVALESGYPIILRTGCMIGAPASVMTMGGGPVSVTDPANLNPTAHNVALYYNPQVAAAYDALHAELVAKYGSAAALRHVVMGLCGLEYEEPMRQYSIPNMQAKGWTWTAALAAFSAMALTAKRWLLSGTNVDLALNPIPSGVPGAPATFDTDYATEQIASFGKALVLGNNGLRSTSTSSQNPYGFIAGVRPQIAGVRYQTATNVPGSSKMGDPETTFKNALLFGANAVELPGGYASGAAAIPQTLLAEYNAKLLAQP